MYLTIWSLAVGTTLVGIWVAFSRRTVVIDGNKKTVTVSRWCLVPLTRKEQSLSVFAEIYVSAEVRPLPFGHGKFHPVSLIGPNQRLVIDQYATRQEEAENLAREAAQASGLTVTGTARRLPGS
jgi:hypothetical protein